MSLVGPANPLLEECFQLPRSVDHCDDFERRRIPTIRNNVRVDRPEAVPRVGQVFTDVTDSWALCQALKRIVQPGKHLVGTVETVFGNIVPNLE
jgi:hypothetical protein